MASSVVGCSPSKRRESTAYASGSTGDAESYDPLFWGPYLSERQWGTIREDYSVDGACWEYLTYKKAVKTAYRWGEDGLLGVCDKFGLLCSSLALWNEEDSILKERLFGLNGIEGNHGEDVKELYYYLDNTPDHSYMSALYKYPQKPFPYEGLQDHGRTVDKPELEILDLDSFKNNEYWDIHVEYAKPSRHSFICKYTVINKSSKSARLHILPQFYFRNTWSVQVPEPSDRQIAPSFQYRGPKSVDALYDAGISRITLHHTDNVTLEDILFTNNDSADEVVQAEPSQARHTSKSSTVAATNIYGIQSVNAQGQRSVTQGRCLKNGFHKYIIHGDNSAVQEVRVGSKFCAWVKCELGANQKACVYWQINPASISAEPSYKKLDLSMKAQRIRAMEFYKEMIPKGVTPNQFMVCKQAIAGLLWSKQFYLYNLHAKCLEMRKLHGIEFFKSEHGAKLLQWSHLDCQDILLMPDKWEFPWFASWDLAIHAVLFGNIDLPFAQEQITAMLSDRYMHPSGQVPGCEFDFADSNPPILAWAVCKLYAHEKPWQMDFIKKCYMRLVISYQWWRKMDKSTLYLFGGGFLGFDNISVFNRSHPPDGVKAVMQADATGWMGMFALNMLQMTLEQCKQDVCVTDMAVRFLRDFLFTAKAINADIDQGGRGLESSHYWPVQRST